MINFTHLLTDIGSFDIKRSIGKGIFGIVSLGTKKGDDSTKYAIKQLINNEIRDTKDIRLFFKEVICQSVLDHMAVLPIVGFSLPFAGTNTFSLITKYMENGSLEELLEKVGGNRAPKEIEDWEIVRSINIFGIAAGMAYIHKHGVIHRDLKTENVMLDEHFYPKICDFGFSKFFKEDQDEIYNTTNIGTPAYMAPEMDSHDYSQKVDVFSYAIILYELWTYKKPYADRKGINTAGLKELVKKGVRPKYEEGYIPDEFIELMTSCWENNPDYRPSSKEIVSKLYNEKEKYFPQNVLDDDDFNDYIEEAVSSLDLME